jgi:hypothetical protein
VEGSNNDEGNVDVLEEKYMGGFVDVHAIMGAIA